MSIHLTIVTPEGQAYDGEVETVVLPGSEGQFGVLERHERSLAPLQLGPVEIVTTDGSVQWAAVTDGYADVSAEQVVVMVDSCTKASDVDPDEEKRGVEVAESELAALSESDINLVRRTELHAEIALRKLLWDISQKH